MSLKGQFLSDVGFFFQTPLEIAMRELVYKHYSVKGAQVYLISSRSENLIQ